MSQHLFFVPNVEGGEHNAPEEEKVYGSCKEHAVLVQDADVLLERGEVHGESLEGACEQGVLSKGVRWKPGRNVR